MSISIDKSYEIIEELERIQSLNKNLEYRVISDLLGKNLILLSLAEESLLNEIKTDLEMNFKDYIKEIYLDDGKLDYYIEFLKNEYKKNALVFSDISYSSWVSNKIEKENYENKNIIAGYSFKGGVGRSQTLAYLSLFFTLLGKKVVVLDCDFEAPGISTLLCENKNNKKSGIVDYLIDMNLEIPLNLKNYYFENENFKNLKVFSSGIDIDPKKYINKISKIDFNSNKFTKDIKILITRIQEKLSPDYIFIDLRAGINESNGHFLKEVAEKSLLFFSGDSQNEIGMEIVIDQLNKNNADNYYLVNSLIRDYSPGISNEKIKSFKKMIQMEYPNYDKKLFFLKHESKLLTSLYETILSFAINNSSLYSNINLELSEALERMDRMTKNLTGKNLVQAMDFKKIVHEKQKLILERNKSGLIDLNKRVEIFLLDLIELIM